MAANAVAHPGAVVGGCADALGTTPASASAPATAAIESLRIKSSSVGNCGRASCTHPVSFKGFGSAAGARAGMGRKGPSPLNGAGGGGHAPVFAPDTGRSSRTLLPKAAATFARASCSVTWM